MKANTQSGATRFSDQQRTAMRAGDRSPSWESLLAGERLGDRTVGLDVAGLRVRLHGLTSGQASWFSRRYGIFAEDAHGGVAQLEVDVGAAPEEGFLQLASGEAELYRMVQQVVEGGRVVRAWSYRFAGCFDAAGGKGRLWLSDRQGKSFETSCQNCRRSDNRRLSQIHA